MELVREAPATAAGSVLMLGHVRPRARIGVSLATLVVATVLGCTPRSASSDGATPAAALVDVEEAVTSWGSRGGDDYPLDRTPRVVPPKGAAPTCDRDDLVTYRGTNVRFASPATVHRAFPERLERFEAIARDVAVEIYGRAPTTLHHGGAFACRTTKSGRYLSEHALGNALDVEGFSFAPLTRRELSALAASDAKVPPAARGAFRVRVAEAWRPDGPDHAKRFFARLLERVRAEDDVFRAIIGPPDPSHTSHLHFDVGRWSYSRFDSPVSSGRGG